MGAGSLGLSKVVRIIVGLDEGTRISVFLKSGIKLTGKIDDTTDCDSIELLDGSDIHLIDPNEISAFTWLDANQ